MKKYYGTIIHIKTFNKDKILATTECFSSYNAY